MELTQKQIDKIKARCEAATVGKWNINGKNNKVTYTVPDDELLIAYVYSNNRENDTKFIANARKDIPLLIEAYEQSQEENIRLQSENAEFRARLDKAVEFPCKAGDIVYPKDFDFYQENCDFCIYDGKGCDDQCKKEALLPQMKVNYIMTDGKEITLIKTPCIDMDEISLKADEVYFIKAESEKALKEHADGNSTSDNGITEDS